MRNNDRINSLPIYDDLDKVFSFHIRVKIMSSEGSFIRERIKLDALDVAQWLVNYIDGSDPAALGNISNSVLGSRSEE